MSTTSGRSRASEHTRAGIAAGILAILLAGSAACAPQRTPVHYLYVLGCGANLTRLDTAAERKVESYDLAQRTGSPAIIPSAADGLDGCLAYQAEYDPRAAVFYTVVPLQARFQADGTREYRILGFSVPGIALTRNLPAGERSHDPPRLELDGQGNPRIRRAEPPETSLDGNQVLQASGASVLVRVFTADAGKLELAVANRGTKKLVRLQSLPQTTPAGAHLTPGGACVLIEEEGSRKGNLALYDAATGQAIREIAAPQIQGRFFLAITPDGKAVFHSGDSYSFVALGRTFPEIAVTRGIAAGPAGVFFADR